MLKKKEAVVFCMLLVMGATLYVASAVKVEGLRNQLDPTQTVSALLVRPEVLEIVSGEFRSLLADYLLLKASVYLGGRYSNPDANKRAVSTLFRQSAALDPYFFQTCYYVQGYLPWWKGDMPKDAIETLEVFKEHRDWDWQPAFFIGFDYFYFLKDNLTASRYLMEASTVSGAQPFLGPLGARLSQRGGDTRASIAFLKAMYASTESESAREEIKRRIEALKGVLVLENGISRYASKFGSPPESLEQLVETGIMESLPHNPWRPDGRYLYEDAKIEF